MDLHLLDWLVIGLYLAFALGVGVYLSRRASRSVDQYFLTGRSLPWWVAGTSMVATSFAADTPLLITGWVRDVGIAENWAWWSFVLTGLLGTFLFARWWRRGGVMTKAEVVELRYGTEDAKVLRGTLGVMHAGLTNMMILVWVMLAAGKIVEVVFEIDRNVGTFGAAGLAVAYSVLSGIWGVVITDLVQFVMAMVGAIALAFLAWGALGGHEGLEAAVAAGTHITADTLRMMPAAGEGGFFDGSFWTTGVASLAVWLGVAWWAAESVDGSGVAVQRIAATRNERHGLLAYLWFNVLHYAVRPWPWILVAVASLVLLPHVEIRSPVDGTVVEATDERVDVRGEDGAITSLPLTGAAADWAPEPKVKVGDTVTATSIVGRTDSEKAYVVMMGRYLPIGLLGLVIASLLAAFMSTIDTHVNLSSAFFVNDVYRRFVKTDASDRHYIAVARVASVVVLILASVVSLFMDSIGELFLFFLALLSGVGPVYVLRWLWWRVKASTEIVAMIASASMSMLLTIVSFAWPDTPLTPDGVLSPAGRLLLVVGFSMLCAGLSLALTRRPDPASLLGFYRRVRPLGAWGPVAALATDAHRRDPLAPILMGILGSLCLIYGLLFATGALLLHTFADAAWPLGIAVAGAGVLAWSLRRINTPPTHAGAFDDA